MIQGQLLLHKKQHEGNQKHINKDEARYLPPPPPQEAVYLTVKTEE
jgi:hypothetical protein